MTRFAYGMLGVVSLIGLTFWLANIVPARQANTAVRVENIKYVDLGKLVRSHKGKVIVVDFWADFCIPCKTEFPHLVALQHKYKGDGFVAVSVALDNPADAAARNRIVAFLGKQQAGGVTNLQLDEGVELWQQKLDIDGPPCVYVFNREGRIAGKWPNAADKVDYEEIEQLVAELMQK
jgi:thiol-disulfide isomerase/thioredoxin